MPLICAGSISAQPKRLLSAFVTGPKDGSVDGPFCKNDLRVPDDVKSGLIKFDVKVKRYGIDNELHLMRDLQLDGAVQRCR